MTTGVALYGVQGRDHIMRRVAIAAGLVLSASYALEAGELCITCEKPAATYRCAFEQATRDQRLQLGDAAQVHICENVLQRLGPHTSCKLVPPGPEPCNGVPRTVTVADYQRLFASDGHSTYQPSVLEKAQRGVSSTWHCLASFFGDC
jgi:hypothetical protein